LLKAKSAKTSHFANYPPQTQIFETERASYTHTKKGCPCRLADTKLDCSSRAETVGAGEGAFPVANLGLAALALPELSGALAGRFSIFA